MNMNWEEINGKYILTAHKGEELMGTAVINRSLNMTILCVQDREGIALPGSYCQYLRSLEDEEIIAENIIKSNFEGRQR